MDIARTPKQLGNLIARKRKQLGWNQTQLGDETGLRQKTISAIENGKPAARLDTVLSILAALDLEIRIAARAKGRETNIEDIF